MSESNRKKRSNNQTSNTLDGDHRKRRRNRTTQSCLNCHTSKRMCDRKRPACARCTQLGLTGLCVYEVDDPNQRLDSQDENARLLKRVAELEGVIRELKNKPHPKWSQNRRDVEKWTRSHLIRVAHNPVAHPDRDGDRNPSSGQARKDFMSKASGDHPTPSLLESESPQLSYYSSPQSTPSPSIMTPTMAFTQPPLLVNCPPDAPPEYDLTSAFLYNGLQACEDSNRWKGIERNTETQPLKRHSEHCGCLLDPTSYGAVLELSLRLRKATDILSQSIRHHMGYRCILNQLIGDLDTFTTKALGNISNPPEPPCLHVDGQRPSPAAVQNQHSISYLYATNTGSLLSKSSSPPSWDTILSTPIPEDDSFMSWEAPRPT